MDRQAIVQQVIQVLQEVQSRSGHEPVEIGEDICPLKDLPGFDSLTSVEATVELARRLENHIPDENIFVSDDGRRRLPVREIADRVYDIITR
jgi:acyl carrier protein